MPDSLRGYDSRHPLGPGPLDENTAAALDRGDGSHGFHRLDLRSPKTTRCDTEGSASADVAGHCGREKRRAIVSMSKRLAIACGAIFYRSATWPRPRFASGGEPCCTATLLVSQMVQMKNKIGSQHARRRIRQNLYPRSSEARRETFALLTKTYHGCLVSTFTRT